MMHRRSRVCRLSVYEQRIGTSTVPEGSGRTVSESAILKVSGLAASGDDTIELRRLISLTPSSSLA